MQIVVPFRLHVQIIESIWKYEIRVFVILPALGKFPGFIPWLALTNANINALFELLIEL